MDNKFNLKKLEPKKRKVLRKPVSKRFEKFEALDCYNEIKERLVSGVSIEKIVNFIMMERPDDFVRLGITEATLERTLYDLRSSLPPGELVQTRMPDVIAKAAEKVDAGVNEIGELGELYNMQKDRIEMEYKTEKKIGKLFKGTGNEIKIASDILRSAADLKMDMGLVKRQLGTMAVDQTLLTDFSQKFGNKDMTQTLSNPEKRRKIMGAVELLMNSADKHSGLIEEINDDVSKEKEDDNQ